MPRDASDPIPVSNSQDYGRFDTPPPVSYTHLDVYKRQYESDDYKDISPFAIATLAKFYGLSTDYLMGVSENKNHPNTELQALHLKPNMRSCAL